MPPKRKGCCHELNVALEHEVGQVTWLGVTNTRDAKNNRQCFGINFHSGSPQDEPRITAMLSGLTRTVPSIPEVEIRESGLEDRTYVRSRIIRAIRELEGI